ncbi:Isochorismate synthase [Nostocoides japonicum T1-X7]|uniref:isochorismate synthase n=1 Tax=Nostocoides japonicum T1-X7 TaxID=1194083 RepID=A0A077LXJ1_9MICO|nr:isochorismate synthase [Tetrasphaera japonica]CCH76640.1 Isochorismate synthase [Tetrasphaera japonica T1-X7]
MTDLISETRRVDTSNATVLFSGDDTAAGDIAETIIGTGPRWAEHVVGLLAPGERAVCVLPFAPDAPAVAHRVTSAARVERHRDAAGRAAAAADATTGTRHRIVERPSRAAYADRIRIALDHIASGRLEKVVLGRGLDVVSRPPLDRSVLMARLLATAAGRYVFGVPLGADPTGPIVLGASPELLVRRRGRTVSSLPLAGSVPRVADPDEDRRRTAALQGSTKDLAEHAYVVDAVTEVLAPLCTDLDHDRRPRLVSTEVIHHLGTSVRGTLSEAGRRLTALQLAMRLHPTPAVGGVPTPTALDVIAGLEEDRGPLTGAIGWVDDTGDGEFAVTIRAGVLDGDRLRLHAGAGIVAGSDPDAEIRETEAKLATMRAVVGL